MNHRWRYFSIAAALMLVLAACTGTQSSTSASASASGSAGTPQEGGTLVFAGARLSDSLDPALTSDGESFRILRQVYETLVDLAPGSTNELIGGLAETWEGEPDGTVYTFHIRPNVKFQDGTDLNAAAVVANFDRMANMSEEFQASAYYYGQVIGFGDDSIIESVEATDDMTVVFTLKRPNPTFLYGLVLPCFGIVSPAILESTNASDFENTTLTTDAVPGGTGPFILESYTPDDNATLVRNENYWGEKAHLDRLIIQPIADPAARLQALQGGSIQGFDLVNPSDYEAVTDGGFQLVERLSFNSLYLGLNPSARDNAEAAGRNYDPPYEGDSPLKDVAVRRAVELAIDKEALIPAFYGGRGSVATTFMPETSQWADEIAGAVTPNTFDPDAARQLLADAGFSESNPAVIHFWYPTEVTRPYMPDPAGLHQAITQMLEDAGFVVESHSDIWDDPGYLFDAQNGYYDLHFLGWTGDWDDPGNFYGIHFAYDGDTPALQFGCAVDGLKDALDAADGEAEPAARGAAWGEVAKLVHDNVCFVTLVHGDTALAFAPNVHGYEANPTGSEVFTTVSMDPE
ncbi:MAG TPA: ABC transporter substrate-binding protein [Candidatus Limnocylindria bacterium]|jgi:peptide/nickel transport system substrate-binding protein|nr:ABC transporter substrate-binding protein [Candidatus Limnocylindria bacterium]